MKDKILMLIVGILIGAIITTGVFLVLNQNRGFNGQRPSGDMPSDRGNFIPGDIPQKGQDATSESGNTASSSNV